MLAGQQHVVVRQQMLLKVHTRDSTHDSILQCCRRIIARVCHSALFTWAAMTAQKSCRLCRTGSTNVNVIGFSADAVASGLMQHHDSSVCFVAVLAL
jgi:hypothetical protein